MRVCGYLARLVKEKDPRTVKIAPWRLPLIGKEEGDIAKVEAPGGVKGYEIVKVSYL